MQLHAHKVRALGGAGYPLLATKAGSFWHQPRQPVAGVCGYRKDHLLVLESQLAAAVDVLEGLIGSCRS
jgi:hypothetical protein